MKVNNIRSSNLPAVGDRDVSGKSEKTAGLFAADLLKNQDALSQERLNSLLDQMTAQGKKLGDVPTYSELKGYRELVRIFSANRGPRLCSSVADRLGPPGPAEDVFNHQGDRSPIGPARRRRAAGPGASARDPGQSLTTSAGCWWIYIPEVDYALGRYRRTLRRGQDAEEYGCERPGAARAAVYRAGRSRGSRSLPGPGPPRCCAAGMRRPAGNVPPAALWSRALTPI